MRNEPSVSEPMIDLLSDDIAQAKGSLVSSVGRRRPAPSQPSVLPIHQQRHLNVAHGRRTVLGHTRMMGVTTEDDDLALTKPSTLEIRNRILCACRRCGANDRQH